MDGYRHTVTSADGTQIGLLTAGLGPQLLLVHGGIGCIETWEVLWPRLTSHWRVTAMDRRGRASSGDTEPYSLAQEYADVAAVAASLASAGPVDAFGHSFGATCLLGAAAGGAQVRRIALYEPGGPQAVPREWLDRIQTMFAEGRVARAMMSFLTEVVGVTPERIRELRESPRPYNAFAILAATMPREARALAAVDLTGLAATVWVPALMVLGSRTPAWAGAVTDELLAALPGSKLAMLEGQGHEATDTAPAMLAGVLHDFLS